MTFFGGLLVCALRPESKWRPAMLGAIARAFQRENPVRSGPQAAGRHVGDARVRLQAQPAKKCTAHAVGGAKPGRRRHPGDV